MIGEELLNLLRGPVLPPGTLGGAPNPSPAAGQPLPQGGQNAGGSPQGPPQPTSNAPQSPPDLAQLYLRLQQRNQSANEIDRGLTTMAASLSTPSMASQLMGNMPQQQDAGAQLGNLMKLQQLGLQRQQMQSMIGSINSGDLTKQTGIPANILLTELYSNPSGFGEAISKGVQIKQGLAGPEPMAALTRARNSWAAQNAQIDPNTGQPMTDANGQPVLKPGVTMPNYLSSEGALTAFTGQQADAAKEKVTQQGEFDGKNAQYNNIEGILGRLNDPNNRANVIAAIQKPNWFTEDQKGNVAAALGIAGVTPAIVQAKADLNQLNRTFYSTEFKGSGRLSQQEAGRLNESFSNLNQPTLGNQQIVQELQRLQNETYKAHANIYASAGQQIPAQFHGLANPQYTNSSPDNPYYTGATEAPIADFSKMNSADADAGYGKLNRGDYYVDTDGKVHQKHEN
jgi:hypothetical protein